MPRNYDGSHVSVFEYDFVHLLNKSTIPLAKNALRKLRTIRHPDVLKFMDVIESETAIFIMTECVQPLSAMLQAWASKSQQERHDWLLGGLHRISVALAFINDSAGSTHGSVRPDTIFISPSGEWKLGGFEILSNPKDDNPVLYLNDGWFASGIDELRAAGGQEERLVRVKGASRRPIVLACRTLHGRVILRHAPSSTLVCLLNVNVAPPPVPTRRVRRPVRRRLLHWHVQNNIHDDPPSALLIQIIAILPPCSPIFSIEADRRLTLTKQHELRSTSPTQN
ncbi:hypothetical protein JVU11DRAFT_9282 [Chiua virens]|nr:hypothetical protein JVU11DRAFT_9282 [Chiua virens]